MQSPLIKLQCGVKTYDWGKMGESSIVAKLAAACPVDDFRIQENIPYAELWMGTHPSNPSKEVHSERTLLDIIQNNQTLLSTEVSNKFGATVPFLFKVISIGKALSIQAHPDKILAKILHGKDPKIYPDGNHKPEMTIALTPFEGLCGFRPLNQLSHFLSTVPSLKKLIGRSLAEEFQVIVRSFESSEKPEDMELCKNSLQKVFRALMKSTPEDIKSGCEDLVKDAQESGENFAGGGVSSNNGQEMAALVNSLNSQFPGDVGLFVLFFLNYVKLDVGEAMFLKANEVHAYLSGDVIECMATSDNVVRAGLTPKFKDIDTLIEMLTYSYAPIEDQKMTQECYPYVTLNSTAYSSNSSVMLFDPPIEEFCVVCTKLRKKGSRATFDAIYGPSLIICTSGSGTINIGSKPEQVETGSVYFVGASTDVVLESSDQDYTTYRAFCEL